MVKRLMEHSFHFVLVMALLVLPTSFLAAGQGRVLISAVPSNPGFAKAAFPGRASGAPSSDQGNRGSGPVINTNTGTYYNSVDAAIAGANPADVIAVLDTFIEPATVHVDRDITLTSASGVKTVLANVDTLAAGDARAWFLVDAGVNVSVHDLNFDGSGHDIYQAFRHRGTGRFQNCEFRNFGYGTYQGFGIVAFGGQVNVSNCSFLNIGRDGILYFGSGVTGSSVLNCTFSGKGAGDSIDYGIELGNGASVHIEGNTIRDCRGVSADGSYSAGILLTTAYGPGTTAEVISNTFDNNEHGIHLGVGSGTADGSTLTAHFNIFVNSSPGFKTYSDIQASVENNWWGCNGGPGDSINCPDSIGGDGFFIYSPWLVLTTTTNPNEIVVDGVSVVTTDLVHNSDGVDTSTSGTTVPDGSAVIFSADGVYGSVTDTFRLMSNGEATTVYNGNGTVTGVGWAQGVVDNEAQFDYIGVGVTLDIFADDFESGDTGAWDNTFGAAGTKSADRKGREDLAAAE